MGILAASECVDQSVGQVAQGGASRMSPAALPSVPSALGLPAASAPEDSPACAECLARARHSLQCHNAAARRHFTLLVLKRRRGICSWARLSLRPPRSNGSGSASLGSADYHAARAVPSHRPLASTPRTSLGLGLFLPSVIPAGASGSSSAGQTLPCLCLCPCCNYLDVVLGSASQVQGLGDVLCHGRGKETAATK